MNSVNSSYSSASNDIKITCSIGIAIYPKNGKDFSQLYKRADSALYIAKQRGKSQFCIYTSMMGKEFNMLKYKLSGKKNKEYPIFFPSSWVRKF